MPGIQTPKESRRPCRASRGLQTPIFPGLQGLQTPIFPVRPGNRIRSMLENSTKSTSTDEHSSPETSERPDGWLCELTVHETATEPAFTTAVSAGSPLRKSASQVGPIATTVPDVVDGSQASAVSCPPSGVAAPVAALRGLHARASDQGFLPIQVEHYVMLLDWTGRELRAGQARGDSGSTGPEHGAPWAQSIELGENCARIRSIVQAGGGAIGLARRCRAARVAGFRARRRLEPPLYRPPARHRAVKRHLD